jgi:hypothetical protein
MEDALLDILCGLNTVCRNAYQIIAVVMSDVTKAVESHTYTHIHVCTHTLIHKHNFMRAHNRMRVYVYRCMRVCLCVHVRACACLYG